MLWSCTSCGACVQQCPVDIEHVDHIIDMRRYAVLVESNFPAELNGLFKGLENKGNPWNMSPTARLDWAKGLDFEVKVVGETIESLDEVDWLFWVGCAGAYEDRAKKTTRAVAELLDLAGVCFGVLGNGETCTGDPARRAGNEFVFQGLAQQNVETFKEYKVKKVVSTCAHCFNTLKNEYKEFGVELEVVHHTQLLNRLVREGKLTPVSEGAGAAKRSITYHDPCYIGRHNGVYTPPRELLEILPGADFVEMPRNSEKSFCCGAGGARMWMEENLGERINVNRTVEAVQTGADQIAVGCPFCRVMLSDGLTAQQAKGEAREEVEVLDVAQMLLASVKGESATRARPAGVPAAEDGDGDRRSRPAAGPVDVATKAEPEAGDVTQTEETVTATEDVGPAAKASGGSSLFDEPAPRPRPPSPAADRRCSTSPRPRPRPPAADPRSSTSPRPRRSPRRRARRGEETGPHRRLALDLRPPPRAPRQTKPVRRLALRPRRPRRGGSASQDDCPCRADEVLRGYLRARPGRGRIALRSRARRGSQARCPAGRAGGHVRACREAGDRVRRQAGVCAGPDDGDPLGRLALRHRSPRARPPPRRPRRRRRTSRPPSRRRRPRPRRLPPRHPASEIPSGGSLFDIAAPEPAPAAPAKAKTEDKPAPEPRKAPRPGDSRRPPASEIPQGGSLFDIAGPEPAPAAPAKAQAEDKPDPEPPKAPRPRRLPPRPPASEIPAGGSLFDIAAPEPAPAAPAKAAPSPSSRIDPRPGRRRPHAGSTRGRRSQPGRALDRRRGRRDRDRDRARRVRGPEHRASDQCGRDRRRQQRRRRAPRRRAHRTRGRAGRGGAGRGGAEAQVREQRRGSPAEDRREHRRVRLALRPVGPSERHSVVDPKHRVLRINHAVVPGPA